MRRLVCLIAFASSGAWACSCMLPGPPCSAAAQSAAVFSGVVLEVRDAAMAPHPKPAGNLGSARRRVGDPPLGSPPSRTVRFAVAQSWLGLPEGQKEVELKTGMGGGDCGYNFRQGGEYLVYAYRAGGELQASICSRTAPIDEAREDLEWLRSLDGAPQASKVSVRVFDLTSRERGGLAGVQIRVAGANGGETGATDASGLYVSQYLPVGLYSVEVEREGYSAVGTPPSVHITPRGCAELRVAMKPQ